MRPVQIIARTAAPWDSEREGEAPAEPGFITKIPNGRARLPPSRDSSGKSRLGGSLALPCSQRRAQFVHARDRQRSVAHGKSDAFRAAGADVAAGQDSGQGRFQGARLAVGERPAAGIFGFNPGEQIAELVARDRVGQPRRLGSAPMKTKIALRSMLDVLPFECFKSARWMCPFPWTAVTCVPVWISTFGCADSVGEVTAHARPELVAADEQVNLPRIARPGTSPPARRNFPRR